MSLTSEKTTNATKSLDLEELNSFYSIVSSRHPTCSVETLQSIIDNNIINLPHSFSLKSVTQIQVLNTYNSLSAKSQGNSPDYLPLKYLSKFFTILLPVFTLLIISIIETGNYPQAWKQAFIVSLNKCQQPSSINDTRPIAKLSYLAKIFDKLITVQIKQYLENNNLFNSSSPVLELIIVLNQRFYM